MCIFESLVRLKQMHQDLIRKCMDFIEHFSPGQPGGYTRFFIRIHQRFEQGIPKKQKGLRGIHAA